MARCIACGYASNLEVATSGLAPVGRHAGDAMPEEFATPGVRSIDELAAFLKSDTSRLAKSRVYVSGGKPVLVLTVGNDQVNETKLMSVLGGADVRAADPETLRTLTGADAGSIGPIGFKGRIVADLRLKEANGLVSGANRNDAHTRGIDLVRDVPNVEYAAVRAIEANEPCPQCGKPLRIANAVELGHIFKLGTKYSEALNAKVLDENGNAVPIVMGSYGIGVERIIACAIEQGMDANGMLWPVPIAPYRVHIIAVNMNNKDIVLTANKLYRELTDAGVECIFDDRPGVSPGFKFKDADLLGMPTQIIVGEKGLKNGQLEVKDRKSGQRTMVANEAIVGTITG